MIKANTIQLKQRNRLIQREGAPVETGRSVWRRPMEAFPEIVLRKLVRDLERMQAEEFLEGYRSEQQGQ